MPHQTRRWQSDFIVKGVNAEDKTAEITMSTPTKDRQGDVVDPMGLDFKNYLKNPVVLWAHDYNRPPIGRVENVDVSPQGVNAKVKFADTPFAQEVFSLYKDGFLKGWSVGFIPKRVEPHKGADGMPTFGKGNHVMEAEVVELSGTPIPANQEALSKAIESGTLVLKAMSAEDISAIVKGTCPHCGMEIPGGEPKKKPAEGMPAEEKTKAAAAEDVEEDAVDEESTVEDEVVTGEDLPAEDEEPKCAGKDKKRKCAGKDKKKKKAITVEDLESICPECAAIAREKGWTAITITPEIAELIEKGKGKGKRDSHMNPDDTFKGGFQGCVDHMMADEGHDEDSARKICAAIGRAAGKIPGGKGKGKKYLLLGSGAVLEHGENGWINATSKAWTLPDGRKLRQSAFTKSISEAVTAGKVTTETVQAKSIEDVGFTVEFEIIKEHANEVTEVRVLKAMICTLNISEENAAAMRTALKSDDASRADALRKLDLDLLDVQMKVLSL